MQKHTLRMLSMGFLKIIALGLLFLSCSHKCGAGAVYVSFLTGDDSNSGKVETAPLKTIEVASLRVIQYG